MRAKLLAAPERNARLAGSSLLAAVFPNSCKTCTLAHAAVQRATACSAVQVRAKLLAALERNASLAPGDLPAAATDCEERCFSSSSSRLVPAAILPGGNQLLSMRCQGASMHVCANAIGVWSGAPAAGKSMWRVDLPGAKATFSVQPRNNVDTRQAEAHEREVQCFQQQQPQLSISNSVPCQEPANLQCIRRQNIRLFKCQHQASAKLFKAHPAYSEQQ